MQRTQSSNPERSERTRRALMDAARGLFVEKGYAGTGTPDIVDAAGMTRGALYHHFRDKRALFAAVLDREAARIAEEVESAGADPDPIRALVEGGEAYLAAITASGRARLLLIEAPAVLTSDELADLEARHGGRTLKDGLRAAMDAGALKRLPMGPLAGALAAAWDRAALAVIRGSNPADELRVLEALVLGLRT